MTKEAKKILEILHDAKVVKDNMQKMFELYDKATGEQKEECHKHFLRLKEEYEWLVNAAKNVAEPLGYIVQYQKPKRKNQSEYILFRTK